MPDGTEPARTSDPRTTWTMERRDVKPQTNPHLPAALREQAERELATLERRQRLGSIAPNNAAETAGDHKGDISTSP